MRPLSVPAPAPDCKTSAVSASAPRLWTMSGRPVARAVVVVEVEAGFADPDHRGMPGQFDEALDVNVRFAGGFMRVNADRAVDVVVALGDRAHAVELADARADGHHRRHAGGARAGDDGIQLAVLLLVVVEVAVAIDESHDGAGAPSPAST